MYKYDVKFIVKLLISNFNKIFGFSKLEYFFLFKICKEKQPLKFVIILNLFIELCIKFFIEL